MLIFFIYTYDGTDDDGILNHAIKKLNKYYVYKKCFLMFST